MDPKLFPRNEGAAFSHRGTEFKMTNARTFPRTSPLVITPRFPLLLWLGEGGREDLHAIMDAVLENLLRVGLLWVPGHLMGSQGEG